MRRLRFIATGLALVLIVGLILILAGAPHERSATERVLRFNQLLIESRKGGGRSPSQLGDYFRLDTLNWYLRGKPTWASEWNEELAVLVELGIFDQREILLTNRQWGIAAWSNLAVSNAIFGTNNMWFVHLDEQRPRWIRVTGTNLGEFESVIKSWDASEPGDNL